MIEIRCNRCRAWYRAQPACPHCRSERPRFNRWLRTASLNSNLYAMANKSVQDDLAVRR